MDAERYKSYDELWKDDSKKQEEIEQTFNHWRNETIAILTYRKLLENENFIINDELLLQAVLDYYSALDETKKSHNIVFPNESKKWGYGMYWYVQRKPIQLLGLGNQESLNVNEEVAAIIVVLKPLNKLLGIGFQAALSDEKRKLIKDLINEVELTFTYRTCTAKSMALMIQGMYTGLSLTLPAKDKDD